MGLYNQSANRKKEKIPEWGIIGNLVYRYHEQIIFSDIKEKQI